MNKNICSGYPDECNDCVFELVCYKGECECSLHEVFMSTEKPGGKGMYVMVNRGNEKECTLCSNRFYSETLEEWICKNNEEIKSCKICDERK